MPVLHRVRESFLPRLSLRRSVTVTVVFFALLVLGFIAYTRIPLGMLPSGRENRYLGIWIPYANATPTEVERQIAHPVENVLRTMSGIRNIRTNSSSGGCWTGIEFSPGTDMADAYNQLRDRADRLMTELPDDVRKVYINKWNTDDIPVLGIDFLLTSDYVKHHGTSEIELRQVVDSRIKEPLERLDGVANVEVWGTREGSVEISLIQERLNAHRIDTRRLIRQLGQDNFAMSSGWVREGARKLYIRSDSRFSSLDEIRNLPLEGRSGLTLRDIALVELALPEKDWFYRLDGNPGFGIVLRKESSANTVEVVERVLEHLNTQILAKPQMDGIKARIYLNQADIILDSLGQLQSSGLWGGLFAVLIIYFFLRRYRMTLVITCAIPLSVMISLTVIYFMGWSLNIVTMMGLIIGIGMVVDNSIVVTEAIYTRRLAGEDEFHASLHGASEVGLAITISTLTTIVVFLPLIFMTNNDEMAFIMARIGMPVIFALLGSLLVALLFIPLVTSRAMSSKQPAEPPSVIRVANAYVRGLDWTMRHRLEAVLVALALFFTVAYPLSRLPKAPGDHGELIGTLYIRFDMPDYYSPVQSDSVTSEYERFVNRNREKYGVMYVQVEYWRGGGSVMAILRPDARPWYQYAYHNVREKLGLPTNAPLSREDALNDFRRRAPRFAGVRMSIDEGRDAAQKTSITLFGENTDMLLRLASEVERRVRLVPGVTEVNSDMEAGKDELQLRVDRNRAQQYGLDGGTIASSLGYVLRGVSLAPYHTVERDVGMRVSLREEDRKTLDQARSLVLVGEDGNRATLGNLVDVGFDKGLQNITRENGKTRVVVSASSTEKDVGDLAKKIGIALQGFEMPRGYQWSLTGRFERIESSEQSTMFAALMAVAFVFLLMGILFESFVLPLSILLSIPFSFLGVYWLLFAFGMSLDMMASIGAVILVGVVVNNAIVLIDLVSRLRAEGFTRHDAIVEAGRQRFRPIIMTSATTICGLIPMAAGNASLVGIPYNTLGTAMVGGMVTSTLLTLFVVPLFYCLFDDARVFVGAAIHEIRAGKVTQIPDPSRADIPDLDGEADKTVAD